MLQAERHRLKDLGQELQVRVRWQGQENGGIYGGGGL